MLIAKHVDVVFWRHGFISKAQETSFYPGFKYPPNWNKPSHFEWNKRLQLIWSETVLPCFLTMMRNLTSSHFDQHRPTFYTYFSVKPANWKTPLCILVPNSCAFSPCEHPQGRVPQSQLLPALLFCYGTWNQRHWTYHKLGSAHSLALCWLKGGLGHMQTALWPWEGSDLRPALLSSCFREILFPSVWLCPRQRLGALPMSIPTCFANEPNEPGPKRDVQSQ